MFTAPGHSLVLTHPSANRGRRTLTAVNEPMSWPWSVPYVLHAACISELCNLNASICCLFATLFGSEIKMYVAPEGERGIETWL